MSCRFGAVKIAVLLVLLLDIHLWVQAAPNTFGFELEFTGANDNNLVFYDDRYTQGNEDLKLNPNAPYYLSQLVDQEMTGNKEVRSVGGEVSIQEVYAQMKSLKKILEQKGTTPSSQIIKSIHIHEFINKENIADRNWFNNWNLYFSDLIFAWRLENLNPGLVLLSRSVGRNSKSGINEKGTVRVIEHKKYFDVEFRGMNKYMDELYRMVVLYNQGLIQPEIFGVSDFVVDQLRQTQTSFEEFIQNLLNLELTTDQINKFRYFTYQISLEKNLSFFVNFLKIVPVENTSLVQRNNLWLAKKILTLLNEKSSTEQDFYRAFQVWAKQVHPFQLLLKLKHSSPMDLSIHRRKFVNNDLKNKSEQKLNEPIHSSQDQFKIESIKKYYAKELELNQVLKAIGVFDKMALRLLKPYLFVFPETDRSNLLFQELYKASNVELKNLLLDSKKRNIILSQGSLKENKINSAINPIFYLPIEKSKTNRCQNIY